ncbi:MAG: response regulator [Acidobacteriota bacterium]
MRFLVCDDNEDIRELLTSVLEGEGHEVVCTGNGREVLPEVQRHRPDLVLLDIRMPDFDGLDVLRALRTGMADPPPVVVLSAKTLEEDRWEALAAGAAAYLLKPFSLSALVEVIGRVAGGGRS